MNISFKKLLISALLGGVILLPAAYFQMALVLAPAIIAFVGIAWGTACAGVAALVSLAGLYAMAGVQGLPTVAMYLPAGIIIWVCLKKKYAYRTAVSLSAAAVTLSLYAINCLPFVLNGGEPFDGYTQYMELFGDAMIATAQEMALTEEMAQTVERFAAYFKVMAPDMAVLSMMALGMISGFACTLIARKLCLKQKVELKPMAPFYRWQLTREFAKGTLVLILGAILCSYLKVKNASAVVVAVECIVAAPYALMGMCNVAFTSKYKIRGGNTMTLSIIALVLLFPYSLYGLVFMGMVDKAFRLRSKWLEASRRK